MLKERLKLLVKDSFIYGLAGGISRFFVLLSLPVVVTSLSQSEFGIYSIFQILISLLAYLILFGMDSAVIFTFKPTGDEINDELAQRRLFTKGLLIQLGFSVLLVPLLALTGRFVLDYLKIDQTYYTSFILVLFTMPAFALGQYFQNWFKWKFLRVSFLINAIGLPLINLGILITLVKLTSLDIQKILLVNLVCQWAICLAGFFRIRKVLLFRDADKDLTALLKFGFPMMLIMLLGHLISSTDRFFLTQYLSASDVGVYSLGQRISMIMTMVVSAFQIAFSPFFVSIWHKPDAPETFSKFQTYYIMAVGLLCLIISAATPAIIRIIAGESYHSANNIAPVLGAGSFIYGLYSFAAIGILYGQKSQLTLYAILAGFFSTILADFLLAPYLLGYGVAFGFLIGNIVLVATGHLLSGKYYKIGFKWYTDVRLIAVFGLLLFLMNSFSFSGSLYLDGFLKALFAGIAYITACFFAFGATEKRFIITLLARLPFAGRFLKPLKISATKE